MRRYLIALGLLLLSSVANAQRAAFVCEALLRSQGDEPVLTVDQVTAETSSFFSHVKTGGVSRAFARQIKAAIQRVVSGTLYAERTGGFAMGLRLTGRRPIQDFLSAVQTDAQRAERAHDAIRAQRPFAVKFHAFDKLMGVARSLTFTAIAGYLTYFAYVNDQPESAAVLGVLAAGAVAYDLGDQALLLIKDLRNYWTLRRYDRGREVSGATTAGDELGSLQAFNDSVTFALESLKRRRRPPTMWSFDRVALPLSRSALERTPNPLTPDEVAAAMRRSADFPLPADPRTVGLYHMFYYDDALDEPVLLVFATEVRPSDP